MFKDLRKDEMPPHGYKQIKAHLIYDIKNDTRHKAIYK